ncbi:MAG: carbamoyl-phosphate synthase small subunit [Chlorobi bacterium]|nr:MAG: glutamine-hydrolyzing carbamoyl-phosphate synthase small subunit [Bacteroidota bacterium]KXK35805.1 MAG: carbamoylphosphate synthase small subunit [Chlorobi bacterium OLB6]MBE2265234.1 glutamine-hydrolyzing carbamoyl-phosphate synthase small subunit [Flavobacteriales bacterium]MBL1160303.1 carbamoyl-phosphate synthase small subunit [Chlorobiota bacterium]MBW7853442.1 glutamine-hydrolyzing carbamoyl-phosphate synthase small subunit [Candidatus Kapabacteria bacterium]MCC6330488.1 glutami
MKKTPALLVLENGRFFEGTAIGAIGARSAGELVFNTAMTGYQEIITDPSYHGQIVTFTYPHIGNYGVNETDIESSSIHARGIVVSELSKVYSNNKATGSLAALLEKNQIAGIEGIDTRALVRMLRTEGAMRCVIEHGNNLDPDELTTKARAVESMEGCNLVPMVSTQAVYEFEPEPLDVKGNTAPQHHIVAVDFGIKRNIMRRLYHHGCRITVVPWTTTLDDIKALSPDGVFLSNGPGDPAAVHHGIELVRGLLGTLPMFGVCLGHQLMALAVGGQTYKLKFGHRGGNHPVKNLRTGQVEITSQNHGFAVNMESLPAGVEVTHINLNDNTCAGIEIMGKNAFAVQYHPEAGPGPRDSDYLFEQFAARIAAH